MYKLYVTTIANHNAEVLKIGAIGQKVIIEDTLKADYFSDYNDNRMMVTDGSGKLYNIVSGLGSPQSLVDTATASGTFDTEDIEFSFDGTYKEYIFQFIGITAETGDPDFEFQVKKDSGSAFNVETTSTAFNAWHEDDLQFLAYSPTNDQTSGTSYQKLFDSVSSTGTESSSGELHIFNPSSEVYVKNYYSRMMGLNSAVVRDVYHSGFFNTTDKLTSINFRVSSDAFAGTINMYGIK